MRKFIYLLCCLVIVSSCTTISNESSSEEINHYKSLGYYNSESEYLEFLEKWPQSKYFDEVSIAYSHLKANKENSKLLYNEIEEKIDFVKIDEYFRKYYETTYFDHNIYDIIANHLKYENSYHYIMSKSDRIDFSNPHSFIVNDLYIFDSITISQWIDTSFVAKVGWWPSELVDYPFANTIYIRKAVNISDIKKRNNMIYTKYVGVSSFVNAIGSIVLLPVFDILYFSKELTFDR